MHFGVHLFPTEQSIQPHELARAAEDRGLESVWFSEHTHIPANYIREREQSGNPLKEYFWKMYDPFIALAHAAAVTEKVRIGTGVNLIIEHDPIVLAKQVATLDQLSRGRFLFGIGAGWIAGEMANHGVEYKTRFSLLKEKVRALKQIWAKDEAEFHGRFVNFDGIRSFPKPYQNPHPPIIMGAEGPKSLECAVEVADGWAPFLLDWPSTREIMANLRGQLAAAGRDMNSFETSVFQNVLPDQKLLDEMQETGVKRYILTVYDKPRDESMPLLDELAKLAG